MLAATVTGPMATIAASTCRVSRNFVIRGRPPLVHGCAGVRGPARRRPSDRTEAEVTASNGFSPTGVPCASPYDRPLTWARAIGGNPPIVAAVHTVAILVLDDVVPFDMAAPMQVFDWT